MIDLGPNPYLRIPRPGHYVRFVRRCDAPPYRENAYAIVTGNPSGERVRIRSLDLHKTHVIKAANIEVVTIHDVQKAREASRARA